MTSVVTRALERLAYEIETSRAEIIAHKASEWPVALGYASWIVEVWVNYISNAIKYGGQPPYVELGATKQENGTVRFWVRDNGPGLKPGELDKLFVQFERLDQLYTAGHGLGLSITQRIVEKLGGEVGAKSGAGQGSTFWFTLPSCDSASNVTAG